MGRTDVHGHGLAALRGARARGRAAALACVFLCLGSCPAWAQAGAASAVRGIVLEDFEAPPTWLTWAGDADPRPSGGLEAVAAQPYSGKQCGSFTFDTSCGSGYVSTDLARVFPPRVTALRFWMRSPGAVDLIVRLVDSSGQTHQQSLPQAPAEWHRVEVDLSRPTESHFGGDNDGQLHQPFRRLQILRGQRCDPKVGTAFLDDIEVDTVATESELMAWYWEAPQIRASTSVPGNLFLPGDKVALRVEVSRPPNAATLRVSGRLFDAWDQPAGELAPVELNERNAYGASLDLLPSRGYYRVQLAVADGDHRAEHETRYAVIPESASAAADPESPFGVNTHFNQGWPASLGPIVKRAGIAWIRDGEASLADQALPVALANQLCYMPCFTAWCAPLAQRFKETLAADPQAERRWDFTAAVAWHQQYAAKYGEHIAAYDLMNEPHGPWSAALGGGWQGGEWLQTFVDYGKQVTDSIHQADPGSKVLWEDIDQLLWYRAFAVTAAAKAIDVISPHSYNLHPSRPYPEQQPTLEQMHDLNALVAEQHLPWEVWIGEVGFSSFRRGEKAPSSYSPQTEAEQAHLLVRMMVLHLAHGVKRIFWYDFMNDGWEAGNPEHNFGLVRNDQLPKPAVVAYANLIHRLRGGERLSPYAIGGGGYAYAYWTTASPAQPVLIAWLMTGRTTEAIPVRSGVTELTVTDLYGGTRRVPVQGHRALVELTESPVYLEGLEPSDVLPYLTSAQTAVPAGQEGP
jgi:hypothetical protein